jgi:HK97 family phage major capsid protein
MKFKTIAEAFNHYMNSSIKEIEQRAAEIGKIIDTDANADIASLNIELEGLKQAKANIEQRSAGTPGSGFNPITGMNLERRASYDATEGDVFASAEYRNAFYKTLLGQKLNEFETAAWNRAMAEQRDDAFSTTGDVAAVIPTTTLNEVVSKARTMGGILSACRGFNVPAKVMLPVGTPTAKAAWNTEGATVDSTEPSVAYVSFGAFEIIKVFSITAAVKRMSIAAFESYLAEELAACVMACLADGVVNGQGTTEGTGLLEGITWVTTPGTTQNAVTFTGNSGAALDFSDLITTVGLLKRGYANGAKWAMNNKTLYSQVYSLLDGLGKPVFVQDLQSEKIGKILGFEVIIDDNLADDVILFGNFNYMGYNLPEGIMVEVSTQSSFKSGRIDYRAMAIADCKPIVTEAFVKLYKAE